MLAALSHGTNFLPRDQTVAIHVQPGESRRTTFFKLGHLDTTIAVPVNSGKPFGDAPGNQRLRRRQHLGLGNRPIAVGIEAPESLRLRSFDFTGSDRAILVQVKALEYSLAMPAIGIATAPIGQVADQDGISLLTVQRQRATQPAGLVVGVRSDHENATLWGLDDSWRVHCVPCFLSCVTITATPS